MHDNKTFQTFWPFTRYMQICGLYYIDAVSVTCESDHQSKRNDFKCAFWKIYATVMLIINWLSACSTLLITTVFFLQGLLNFSEIVKMSCISLWLFQNSINASTCYYLCWNNRLHKSYFEKWDQLYCCKWSDMRLARNLAIFICVFLNTFNMAGWFIVAFDLYPDLYLNFFPVLKFIDPSMAWGCQMIWGVAGILSTPSWSLPTALFFLISLSIINMFRTYNTDLEKKLTNSDENIENHRLHYQRLIEIVESADSLFGVYIFSLFIVNLATLSLIMYRMVYYADTIFSRTIDMFWFFSQLTFLSVVSCISAWLNVVAHQVLDKLYSVFTDRLPSKQVLQLSLFISRLKDGTIGYTGCGFFLITKGFLITLVSLFFTYFFLLQQFGNVTSTTSSTSSYSMNFTSQSTSVASMNVPQFTNVTNTSSLNVS